MSKHEAMTVDPEKPRWRVSKDRSGFSFVIKSHWRESVVASQKED